MNAHGTTRTEFLPVAGLLIGDRYRLTDQLGASRMSWVWRAEDTNLSNGPCAVKIVKTLDADLGRRMDREVRLLSGFSDPGIVFIRDDGVHEEHRYLVMNLIPGMTLAVRFGEAKSSPQAADPAAHSARVADIMKWSRQLLATLAVVHGKGITHRDIKPSNIIWSLSTRAPVLIDFGVAKGPTENRGPDAGTDFMTELGYAIGSPGYAAPEQYTSPSSVDARADLFSVGVLMYEALAGSLPFPPQRAPEGVPEPPLSARLPTGPLADVVMKALSTKPTARYQSASDMLEAISAAESQVAAPTPTRLEGLTLPLQRRPELHAWSTAALINACELAMTSHGALDAQQRFEEEIRDRTRARVRRALGWSLLVGAATGVTMTLLLGIGFFW